MVNKKKQFVIAVKIQMVGLRCSAVTHDPDPGPNRLRAPKLTSSSSRLYGTISTIQLKPNGNKCAYEPDQDRCADSAPNQSQT